MSIADKISRLQDAKTAIASAITAKGGSVAENDGFEEFPNDIAAINTNARLVEAFMRRNFTYWPVIEVNLAYEPLGMYALANCTFISAIIFRGNTHGIQSYALQTINNSSDPIKLFIDVDLEHIDFYISENATLNTTISDIYFTGTEEQWNNLRISTTGNDSIFSATKHFNWDGVYPPKNG